MVFDIEADGLVDEATKIHVLSYSTPEGVMSTQDYNQMRQVLKGADKLVAHNGIRYDAQVIKKLLGVDITNKVVDTLALSWYLNFDRIRHGLEWYGVDYGIPKPVVTDWENLTYEEYKHRCEEDVKINLKLWEDLDRKLTILYPEEEDKTRFLNYLMFKMQCAAEQEQIGWRLDLDKAQAHYDTLTKLKVEKEVALSAAMPKVPVYKEYNKPKVMYKKDGSISALGERWLERLREAKMPQDYTGTLRVVDSWNEGNPNSHEQVKDWLHGLGWQPKTFKYVREDGGSEREIEQIRENGELCESVKDLLDKDPAIELLDGLSVITHRLGIFKGFLECHKNGWLKAEVNGLTNTMRFKHSKPLVNLPGVHQPWGKEIRECLIAPSDDHVLVGTDMVSLEDTTKRHYMQPLDPDYVGEMSQEGFDPHLNLAMFAGVVTQEEIDKHNSGEVNLKDTRKKFKAANYSCVYGVGAPKLARSIGTTQKEAKELIEAYWRRNWAIRVVAEKQTVRLTGPHMWLKNPVSGFWHQLRADKDRFSTLNQSTGVYCFDTWVAFCRAAGLKVCGQFHDETITPILKRDADRAVRLQQVAIDKANKKLKLNVTLDISPQVGNNYADIH